MPLPHGKPEKTASTKTVVAKSKATSTKKLLLASNKKTKQVNEEVNPLVKKVTAESSAKVLKVLTPRVVSRSSKVGVSKKSQSLLNSAQGTITERLCDAIWFRDLPTLKATLSLLSARQRLDFLQDEGQSNDTHEGPLRVALMTRYPEALSLLFDGMGATQKLALLKKEKAFVEPILAIATNGDSIRPALHKTVAVITKGLSTKMMQGLLS